MIKIGDKITWSYFHWCGNYRKIRKTGTVIRFVGYRSNPKSEPFKDDIVIVQFEGNKKPSRIPYGALTHVS